jgi:hypothetical protein
MDSSFKTPSLTTISQHGVEIGEVAQIIDRLESKEENLPYETVVIKTKLKERESTRKGNHYRSRYNKKTICILNCKWFFYFILLTSFFSISCSPNYLTMF